MKTLASNLKSGLTVTLLVFLGVAPAAASIIAVANPSFEQLPAGGLPSGCGAGCSFSSDAIPGWTNTGFSGQFQPGVQAGTFSFFSTLSDGLTSAYSNGPVITQTVGATVQAGVTYTLVIDLGSRNDTGFGGSADLLVNGVPHVATGVIPTQGNWGTFTATYVGLPGDVGAAITIELHDIASQGNFDNVRLSDDLISTAVPEPGTAWLALGLPVVFWRLSKTKTA